MHLLRCNLRILAFGMLLAAALLAWGMPQPKASNADATSKSIGITIFRLGNAQGLWTMPKIKAHADGANHIWGKYGRTWNWNGTIIDLADNLGKSGDVVHTETQFTEYSTHCVAALAQRKAGTLPVILIRDFTNNGGMKISGFNGLTRAKGGGPFPDKSPGDCVLVSYQAHNNTTLGLNPKPGTTFAHEFGHVLCLDHPDIHNVQHPADIIGPENLMYDSKFLPLPGGGMRGQALTALQVQQAQDCMHNFTEGPKTTAPPGVYNILAIVEAATVGRAESKANGECAGNADDDADTVVNDGCPAVGPAEAGANCTNATDDDGDGRVNDGCPAVLTGNQATAGTYFHCVARLDTSGAGPVFDVGGAAVCYQDSPSLDALSSTPPPNSADGIPGPPPPPPYGLQPPSAISGTWDSTLNTLELKACFHEVGTVGLRPNVVAVASVNAKTGKGQMYIYGGQSSTNCDALTPAGLPLLSAAVKLTRQDDGFDHDQDGCTDFDELEVPQLNKCGDDPYNPHDGPSKAADLTGVYDSVSIVVGQDEPQPTNATYFSCRNTLIHNTGTDALTGKIFCYTDSKTIPVNGEVPLVFGDGYNGAPPPFPFSEVPQATTPQDHTNLAGDYDSGTNEVSFLFCFEDAENDASLGNVIVRATTDSHTGIGSVDIFIFQTDPNCTALTPGTAEPVQPEFDNVPLLTTRQSNDFSLDSDQDGCTDSEELGNNQLLGGHRDPANPYDFFDPNADKAIAGGDFFAVLGKFNSTGNGGILITARPIPGGATYWPTHDRGTAPVPGSNGWNSQQPDGNIAGGDFFAVLGAFNHSCQAAPN